MGSPLEGFLAAPNAVLTALVDAHAGVHIERTLGPRIGGYVVDFRFDPPPELVKWGYDPERGRISVRPMGDPLSFPLGPPRRWKHRYPSPLGIEFGHCCAQLCLWVPEDPRPLRWVWEDGLDDYVSRLHRHLFLEEYWRRSGVWATEDAPHGAPTTNAINPESSGTTHPIKSNHLKRSVAQWQKDRRKALGRAS